MSNDTAIVPAEIKALVVDPTSNTPIVWLRSREESPRILPIWIGLFEANAIALSLEGVETPRPMTHDLAVGLMGALGGSISRVLVSDLIDGTFYAQISLESEGKTSVVDARPSDALALALRSDAPVYVAEKVLEAALKDEKTEALKDDERIKKLLEELDDEDLGKYTM